MRFLSPLFRCAAGALLSACLAAAPSAGSAQVYPTRTITLVVPFEAGGGSDTAARLIAEKLSERVGQPVVVDNRPGASATIGTRVVAEAEPDGYTLLFCTSPTVSNPAMISNLPYDTLNDFEPVARLVSSTMALTVNPALGVDTLQEFIDLAKSRPGELNYSTSGIGNPAHLSVELLASMAGLTVQAIPFQGSSTAVTAAVSNEVDFTAGSLPPALPFIESGQLTVLGVTNAVRSSALPDVPTIGELLPGFESENWYGVMAPADTPKEVVDFLNAELNEIVNSTEVREIFSVQGLEPYTTTPEEFGTWMTAEIEKWKQVVADAGIQTN